MDIKNKLVIISCGISGDTLSDTADFFLQRAKIVAGGSQLLDKYAKKNHKQITIGANAVDVCKELIKRSKAERVVILASGDSLYNGIAGTIGNLISSEKFTVIPNITAFQDLFAKLGISWNDIKLFSAHGSNGRLPWRQILSSNKAVIYGDNILTADKIAKLLIEKYPDSKTRDAVAAMNLGLSDEKIVRGTLEELVSCRIDGLSMLTVLECPSDLMPSISLGLNSSDYHHKNSLITKPEVRAVILSKLSLKPGIMWDLGAGSGSVGLEATGLLNDLKVYSVEKELSRIKDINCNIKASGLNNIKAVYGDILTEIKKLPDPDMIFIGGGGVNVKEIVKTVFLRLKFKGRLVVSTVTLDTVATLSNMLITHRKEVVNLSISHSKPVGGLTMMKAENPITLFVYEKGAK